MTVVIALPGRPEIELTELVLDYTGTLSRDGVLLAGVAERITALAARLRVTVMTADTRGTARRELAGLPLTVELVRDGKAKAERVRKLGPGRTAAVGNGRNDVAMVRLAALGIAVLGDEGTAGELIRVADVVAPDITSALDLLADPVRLVATLRD
jgi:soluble P-type ATPase